MSKQRNRQRGSLLLSLALQKKQCTQFRRKCYTVVNLTSQIQTSLLLPGERCYSQHARRSAISRDVFDDDLLRTKSVTQEGEEEATLELLSLNTITARVLEGTNIYLQNQKREDVVFPLSLSFAVYDTNNIDVGHLIAGGTCFGSISTQPLCSISITLVEIEAPKGLKPTTAVRMLSICSQSLFQK